MTPVTHAKGQTVALFGLGGSGLATARALKAGGARVIACDDGAAPMAKAAAEGIETADLRAADWTAFSSLVLSPGVPLTHKDGAPFTHWTAKLARDHRVEIVGDVELFCRERRTLAPDAPFVAISGTNGKSTTTALVAHILREAGRDVQMGGNIGTAVLSLAPPAMNRFHVVECSSFQIDLAPTLDPTVGALLNVTPDHLDRHGDMTNYAAIKARLLRGTRHAVGSIDDEPSRIAFETSGKSRDAKTRLSLDETTEDGVVAVDGEIRVQDGQTAVGRVSVRDVPTLRGRHNWQNAAAATAIILALAKAGHLQADDSRAALELVRRGLRTFPGLAHRLEQLGCIGKALVINDSKATNADSTEKALLSFPGDIFWILGGKAKEGGIEPLRPYFGRIAKAYLIGAATDEFAASLAADVPFERCGALDVAVAAAVRDAASTPAPEPVVLLSPACASYDQYPNFEVRGDAFRALVASQPEFVPARAQA